MANGQVDTGHGASIVFGTSLEAFNVTGIKLPKGTREPIPTNHLLSTKMTVIAGDMEDHDNMTVEFQWDAEASIPDTDTAAQTVTVTFPLVAGGSSAATYAGTALIVGVDTPNLVTGELQTGSFEVKFDEATGPTFTVAT